MVRRRTAALLGSLDTKEEEIQYAKEILEDSGCGCIVLDVSTRDTRKKAEGFSPEELLEKGGVSGEEFAGLDKAGKIEAMGRAVGNAVPGIYEEGLFQGIISFGGGQNARMAAEAMKKLPFGIPKLLASPMICGNHTLEQYIGTKDILAGHTVADVGGLNTVTKTVIRNYCHAMAGMLRYQNTVLPEQGKVRVGLSTLGITTEAADGVRRGLPRQFYEVTCFHANGVGGRCMEELEEEMFDLILDMNLHEITCEILGGYSIGASNRLAKTVECGIPLIVVPGAVNVLDYYVPEGHAIPEKAQGRRYIWHNGSVLHAKITEAEAKRIARVVAERLNRGKGLISVILPEGGFSLEDGSEEDLRVNQAFSEELCRRLVPDVRVLRTEGNINGRACRETMVEEIFTVTEKIQSNRSGRSVHLPCGL